MPQVAVKVLYAAAEDECLVHPVVILGINAVVVGILGKSQAAAFKAETVHDGGHLVGFNSTHASLFGESQSVAVKGTVIDHVQQYAEIGLTHAPSLSVGIVVMAISLVASLTLHLAWVVDRRAAIVIVALFVAFGSTPFPLVYRVRNLNTDLRASGGGIAHGLGVEVGCCSSE